MGYTRNTCTSYYHCSGDYSIFVYGADIFEELELTQGV